ncbi:hypothetical protein V8D89_002005 [Ganoderma adspersum]
MRLLDLITGDFVEFSCTSTAPPYAILSHRWDATEQTYQKIKEIQKSCEKNRRSSAAPAPTPRARFRLLSGSSLSHNGASSFPPSLVLPESIWDSESGLSDKVRRACKAAREDGFRHLWIDSCCIDKTSSSELSESINSMFAWYRDAEVCYTFLVDVPTSPFAVLKSKDSAFRSSVWFTRGWTLQELIAPRRLVFLSQTWEPLGTKASLAALIEEITGIPMSVLAGGSRGTAHRSLDECGVAQRMSWAAHRKTTKEEDQAYCLLGIFDIQMSPLYGEGKRAFRRLQEEILRRIPDQTIFAWGNVYPEAFSTSSVDRPVTPNLSPIRNFLRSRPKETAGVKQFEVGPSRFNFYASGSYMVFADSPADFAGAGRVVAVPLNVLRDLLAPFCGMSPQEYIFTPHGIRTDIPLLPLADCLTPNLEFYQDEHGSVDWHLAVLACEHSAFPGQLLCCVCHLPSLDPLVSTLRRGSLMDVGRRDPMAVDASYTLFRLSLPDGKQHLDVWQTSNLPEPETITFTLPAWCRGALDTQGYVASLAGPSDSPNVTVGGGLHRLTLSPRRGPPPPRTQTISEPEPHRWTITADFSCVCRGSDERTIRAAVRIAGGNELVCFTRSLELRHIRLGSSGGWHWDRLVGAMKLEALGHESVRLELGVQLASVSCYRIHVEFVGGLLGLPVDSE